MIQLKVLSGKMAGAVWTARHFPVRIGRSPAADLRLEEEGVWDEHLRLDFDAKDGFSVSAQSGALATVNGQTAQQAFLTSGDLVEIGSVKMQFWLAKARQGSLRIMETAVWLLLGLVPVAQLALVYWLAK